MAGKVNNKIRIRKTKCYSVNVGYWYVIKELDVDGFEYQTRAYKHDDSAHREADLFTKWFVKAHRMPLKATRMRSKPRKQGGSNGKV